MSRLRRLALILLGLFTLLFGGTHLTVRLLSHDLPEPRSAGPEADALARAIEQAVDRPAWERTGAVTWLARTGARHLWDRRRGLARVEIDGVVVLLDTASRRGQATRGETRLEGPGLEAALEKAYALWINDNFWLNPLVKLFDEGVLRERTQVELDGKRREALLISYTRGGLTPGDRYLWILGDDGWPIAARMWVSVIPVPGVDVSWTDWVTLPTGARVATMHRLPLGLEVPTGELRAAVSLAELMPGPDPFAAIVAH